MLPEDIVLKQVVGNLKRYFGVLLGIKFIHVNNPEQDQMAFKCDFNFERFLVKLFRISQPWENTFSLALGLWPRQVLIKYLHEIAHGYLIIKDQVPVAVNSSVFINYKWVVQSRQFSDFQIERMLRDYWINAIEAALASNFRIKSIVNGELFLRAFYLMLTNMELTLRLLFQVR